MLGDYDGTILLLCGDTPLVTKESLEALLEEHKNSDAAATILTAHMPDQLVMVALFVMKKVP